VRIARDQLRRIRELSDTLKVLEAEIAQLVAQIAPQLLPELGLSPLTAAKPVGEIAGASRFATDAELSRAAGVAPIPVAIEAVLIPTAADHARAAGLQVGVRCRPLAHGQHPPPRRP
jgi:hypothetical protein